MSPTQPDTADRRVRRAQSETVGVVLLTAVIVVAATLVGAGVTARFVEQADTGGAPGDAEVAVTADNLTVTHAGGTPIADGDFEVIIGNGSYEEPYSLTDAIARTGDGDGRFEASETATFGHGFSPGEVTIRVIDRGSNTVVRRADLTVPTDEPANFTLRVDNTNSPVTEGERLEIRATVENTGDQRATQPVSLSIDGGVGTTDTRDLTLEGGESEQVTLTWDTASGEAGTYTATVSSGNDSATTSVQVLTPANFAVTIDGTNSPIVEGETLLVNATVQNTGQSADIQIIKLAVNDPNEPNSVDITYLGLSGGETKTLPPLEWSNTIGDGGPGGSSNSYTVNVSSHDDFATQTVEVQGSGGGGGPTADANGPYTVDEGSSVILDGSGSTADTGNIQSYSWTIRSGSGTLTDADSEQATYDAPSNVDSDTDVTVELTVTDNKGNTDSDTTTVTVNDTGGPDAPSLDTLDVTTTGNQNRMFEINADVSDPTGDGNELKNVSISVVRTVGNGNEQEDYSNTISVSGDSDSITDTTDQLKNSEEYDIRVTVYDTAGNSDTATRTETT